MDAVDVQEIRREYAAQARARDGARRRLAGGPPRRGARPARASVWLSLALATFGRFMRAGRREGSLEYAS